MSSDGRGKDMMGYGGFGGMALFGSAGMLIWIVLWVAVIAVMVWGVSTLFSGSRGPRREEDPLAILQRRYARGEINQAEYDRAKQSIA